MGATGKTHRWCHSSADKIEPQCRSLSCGRYGELFGCRLFGCRHVLFTLANISGPPRIGLVGKIVSPGAGRLEFILRMEPKQVVKTFGLRQLPDLFRKQGVGGGTLTSEFSILIWRSSSIGQRYSPVSTYSYWLLSSSI